MEEQYLEEDQIELIDLCEFSSIPKEFDVGNSSIMRYYNNNAIIDHTLMIARTKVIKLGERIIGFFTLSTLNICLEGLDSDDTNQYPSIFLKYIGINEDDQGRGYGKLIIDYLVTEGEELSKFIGFRCFYIEAVVDKIEWYLNRGFQYVNEDDKERINEGDFDGHKVQMIIDFRSDNAIDALC